MGRSRPPSCTVRKACSWHSTLTTPPASLALKFCVSCEAGGQPCSWEGSLPAPKSLHTLYVSLVLYENQDFCLGFFYSVLYVGTTKPFLGTSHDFALLKEKSQGCHISIPFPRTQMTKDLTNAGMVLTAAPTTQERATVLSSRAAAVLCEELNRLPSPPQAQRPSMGCLLSPVFQSMLNTVLAL